MPLPSHLILASEVRASGKELWKGRNRGALGGSVNKAEHGTTGELRWIGFEGLARRKLPSTI